MFTYSIVEGALAEFFGVRPKAQPALRSRIRHIQRFGLLPEKSGNRLLYKKEDVYDLALLLSLVEFGLDPRHFVSSDLRYLIRDLNKSGTKWKEDRWLCQYRPVPLSSEDTPLLAFITAKRLGAMIKAKGTSPRLAVIDLVDLVERIDTSLEE